MFSWFAGLLKVGAPLPDVGRAEGDDCRPRRHSCLRGSGAGIRRTVSIDHSGSRRFALRPPGAQPDQRRVGFE